MGKCCGTYWHKIDKSRLKSLLSLGCMPPSHDLLEQFKKLSPPEREEFLFHLAHNEDNWMMLEMFPPFMRWMRRPPGLLIGDYPGIVSTPDVCGGSARVIRTRIPVWTLERMRQLGASEADLLRSYPSIRAVDLVQAWAFADAHRAQIEKEIQENESDDDSPGEQASSRSTRKRSRKKK